MKLTRKRGIEAGADVYVIKPDIDGLVASIRQFVSDGENAKAKSILFLSKMSFSPPFTFEPAAA